MYLNTISVQYSRVLVFISTDECFTPHNPRYKKVQETLEKMGYVPECNHTFNGELWTVKFTHQEIDVYVFGELCDIKVINENRSRMDVADKFIGDLEYIFTRNAPIDKIESILMSKK